MHRKVRKIVLLILFLLPIWACAQEEERMSLETIETELEEKEERRTENSIFVYVCGAVVNEGVYELPTGSRVYEAIQKAGGFSEEAAVSYINQAEILEDETRIYVPTMEEVQNESETGNGKVNLNTASKEELMTLPGVGESKANLIIRYREEQGKFRQIEDVMNISGIKEGLFEKIKENITI